MTSTGISLNWVEPSSALGSRDESGVEVWYKFPLISRSSTLHASTTMAIINPALWILNNDFASAFSIRLVTTVSN